MSSIVFLVRSGIAAAVEPETATSLASCPRAFAKLLPDVLEQKGVDCPVRVPVVCQRVEARKGAGILPRTRTIVG